MYAVPREVSPCAPHHSCPDPESAGRGSDFSAVLLASLSPLGPLPTGGWRGYRPGSRDPTLRSWQGRWEQGQPGRLQQVILGGWAGPSVRLG